MKKIIIIFTLTTLLSHELRSQKESDERQILKEDTISFDVIPKRIGTKRFLPSKRYRGNESIKIIYYKSKQAPDSGIQNLNGNVSEDVRKSSVYRLDTIVEFRHTTLDFARTMIRISPISTLSAFVGDFSKYSNQEDKKKNLALNIQTYPIVALGGKNWYGVQKGRGTTRIARNGSMTYDGWIHTVHMVPAVNIRILRNDFGRGDTSMPVRTPSYLQGASWYFTKMSWWNRPGRPDTVSRSDHNNVQVPIVDMISDKWYGRFKGYHHSNGQDGWLRGSTPYDSTSHYWDQSGRVNTYNGDFGMQVVFEFGIGFYRFRDKNDTGPTVNARHHGVSMLRDNRKRSHSVYLGWEFVPHHIIPGIVGSRDIVNEYFYATNRLHANYTFIFARREQELRKLGENNAWGVLNESGPDEKLRIIFDLEYLSDRRLHSGNRYDFKVVNYFDISKRLNLVVTSHVRIRGTGNASFFIQGGYLGSDPYNMYFATSRLFLRWGIGWGLFLTHENEFDTDNSAIRNPDILPINW